MVKSGKTAFLFDLDGVLIDSESEYTRIWQHIDDLFPSGVQDFATKIKGTTLTNILGTYFPDTEKREKARKLLYELEGEMRYEYCDGAPQLLAKLSDQGIPFALVTSSDDKKMAHLFDQHPELKDIFGAIIDSNKVTHSKPDPEGYLIAAAELGVEPRCCIVVEDSIQGMRAGRAAGAYVIGVAGTIHDEFVKPECDLMIHSLTEIDLPSLLSQSNS